MNKGLEVKMKKTLIPVVLVALFLLSACNLFKIIQTPASQETLPPAATETPVQAALPTLEPPAANSEPAATETVVAPPPAAVDTSAQVYLDDRSSPAAMIFSLVNALNRHEFIRAYSYWNSPSDYLGTLDAFSSRFADLSSAQVLIGDIYGEGAAGSIYYTAPILLKISNSDGSSSRLTSCLLLRFPQPANFGAPPIDLLHIERGSLDPVPPAAGLATALANACSGADYASAMTGNPAEPLTLEDFTDLGPDNYIDNRSGAVEVVSSLFNAINRHEYVRAYSYWQDPNAVGPYADYANGFSDTGEIKAVFGDVISDAGAGQYYYQVPVAQLVTTTGGNKQTFVGCFTLHLANPGMQATLPFEPLGIKKGHFEVAPNGSKLAPLLATACN